VLSDGFVALEQLIQCLARDAINVQFLWDEAHDRDQEWFAALLSQLPAELRQFLLPLAPARLRETTFQITTNVRVRLSRETGFALQAVPINMGFSLRSSVTEQTESSICFTVEQVPAGQIPIPHQK
jgi:hypothetical protein